MTRTALLSDVHGNAVALRAVLADLEHRAVDHVVCLGDMVQGGPAPAETVELLRGRGWPTVMGNSDAFLLDAAAAEGSPEPITERHLEVRLWSLAQLSDEQRAYVASFTPTVTADLGGNRTLLGCHGSPRSYDDVLLPATPEPELRERLEGVVASIVAGGHVHLPFVRRVGERLFVNPGSVGLGYDHEQPEETFRADPWASYAIVTSDGGTLGIELLRVPFDAAEVVRVVLSSGIPYAEDHAERWRAA